MASSLAKECLSPVLKNSSLRRRSLDLCQQLGSQLLSPNLFHQFTPSASSSQSAQPHSPCSVNASPANSSNKSTPSPFKRLLEDHNHNRLLSTSPHSPATSVFSFGFNDNGDVTEEETGSVSPLNYSSNKRRASDSFWIVDKFTPNVIPFEKLKDSLLTPQLSNTSSSSSPYSLLLRDKETTTTGKEESNEKKVLSTEESKHESQQQQQQQAVCPCGGGDCRDGCSNEEEISQEATNRKIERSSDGKVTCNIIPPTPLKVVAEIGNNEEGRKKSVMPPLFRCSLLGSDSSGSSESESEEDAAKNIFESDRKQTRTCNFPLGRNFLPVTSSLRRCSAGAKYDLDENLIKLVALHWNLSLNPEELLGKGSFGTVVAGRYQGKQVAVKVLKTTNAQRKASIVGEDNALNLPFHNHIARTLDIFQLGPDRTLIIMEKMPKGNLITLLNDPTFEINPSTAINISKQIALGLIFCHRQGILHLDVKPQNVLVDYQNCCKLSDFGSSKKISDLGSCYEYSTLEGTVPYTAPELFRGARPTEKCDVYSFAITMWQIITREMPYEDENEHTVIFRVVSQGLRPGNGKPTCSENQDERNLEVQYRQLYEKSWDCDSEKRPTMTDIHKSLIKIQFLQI